MIVPESLSEGDSVVFFVELYVEDNEIGLRFAEGIDGLRSGISDPGYDKAASSKRSLKITSGDPVVLNDQESQADGREVVHEGT